MKNKRASLLLPEETLKMVIAVICIVFLVLLLVSLYFSLTGNQKKQKAEASMNNLISPEIIRINNGGIPLEEGKLVPNPSGWYIFGFVGEDLKPNLCVGANCICICERVLINFFDLEKRQVKKCDDKGSCFVVSNLKKFEDIKIENAETWISITKVNGEIEIKRK